MPLPERRAAFARLPGDRAAGVGRPLQRAGARAASPWWCLSTHFDCVPPFFPSRAKAELCFGRGACDAKGTLVAQMVAAERLRAGRRGQLRPRSSWWARSAAATARRRRTRSRPPIALPASTASRRTTALASATRGVLRVRLTARARCALSPARARRLRHRQAARRSACAPGTAVAVGSRARRHVLLDRPDLGRRRAERDFAGRRRRADVPHGRRRPPSSSASTRAAAPVSIERGARRAPGHG